MWTAPALQWPSERFDQIVCVHMSGLLVQFCVLLAKMVSAAQIPNNRAVSKDQWGLWNALRLGSIDHTICSFCKVPHQVIAIT